MTLPDESKSALKCRQLSDARINAPSKSRLLPKASIAARRLHGTQKHEVDIEVDLPVRTPRGALKVGDARVEWVPRVDGEPDQRVDAFEAAGIAERLPALVGTATKDLELGDGHEAAVYAHAKAASLPRGGGLAARLSSRASAPSRIVSASGNMSRSALVKTTF